MGSIWFDKWDLQSSKSYHFVIQVSRLRHDNTELLATECNTTELAGIMSFKTER